MLKFDGVKKSYGSHLILDVPSLEINTGIYWLKGGNGSGKSTLLKMASGIIPFEGEIMIDSVNLKRSPVEYRNLVSYAEAEPVYPSYISGLDLINFYQKIRKEEKQKTSQLIELFGIGTYYKDSIGTYSSGMLKKLSLVLAFIGNVKYIFLDEPLVTIDQKSLPIIYKLISECLETGTNLVFTSHQPIEYNGLRPAIELEASGGTVRFL